MTRRDWILTILALLATLILNFLMRFL